MVHRGVLFVVAASIALGGCSATREHLPDWLGGNPPPPASPVAAEQFYVGADGLTVYAKASGSSAVVGRLSLHERVTRSELVRGYAHVVADESGLEGWVDNGKLLWRLPDTGAAAAPVTTPPAVNGETPAPAAPETQPAPAKPTVSKDVNPF